MFEWMSKRGVHNLVCRMCRSSLPPKYFVDFGEHDPRTYVCHSCREQEDPPPQNTLWKECLWKVSIDLANIARKTR